METKNLVKVNEIVIITVLFISILIAIYLRYFVSIESYLGFVKEDGIIEYLTFFFLLLSSFVCLTKVIKYINIREGLWILTWSILAGMFFFAAGDEISWGQRIFNIQSSEFFLEHNKQAETNIHNLVIGGTSINKLVFSQIMFTVLAIYFLFSRLMVAKIRFVRDLVNRFRIPLPRTLHIITMVVALLLILTIQQIKDSELNELSFAMIFFMIFLNPANIDSKKQSACIVDSTN
ncbi:MAG TPA: hypothetical protein PK521_15920 [Bacteroidales bacterium]|nr:hypothetical protein [Bacteroidales bacterium]HQM70792.1 hypothetical protein [Bacteroidales bacterium]